MKIEIINETFNYGVGEVVDVADSKGRMLIQIGKAKLFDDKSKPAPKTETKVVDKPKPTRTRRKKTDSQ